MPGWGSVALVVRVDPRHYAHQSGLSCTVVSEDTDLGSGIEGKVDILEDLLSVWKPFAQLVHLHHSMINNNILQISGHDSFDTLPGRCTLFCPSREPTANYQHQSQHSSKGLVHTLDVCLFADLSIVDVELAGFFGFLSPF